MITGNSTVAELFQNQIDFLEFFDLIIESNKFKKKSTKDFIRLSYQTVMDVLEFMKTGEIVKVIASLTKYNETEILNANASEFLSYLKFIKNQTELINKLLSSLAKEEFDSDDMLLQSAGVDKLDKYNEIMVYYSIDKNPTTWNAIGKEPFSKIFTKLLIDKDMNTINKNYTQLLKQKNK
jgi:hypothetical protein